MTVDERIERLTERHEALTQSVEMLGFDVAATTANIDRLAAETHRKIDDLTRAVKETNESIHSLLLIAASHQRRLTELEG
jgi:uncharacterized protein YoxC